MSSEVQLNPAGQLALAGTASIIINGITHPLSTLQTCRQSHQPIPRGLGLFRGLTAICAVDAAAFGIAYLTNDRFQAQFGPLGASIAAAGLGALPAAVGEGAMANRQRHNLSYANPVVWRRALRIRAMVATFGRDIPWNVGLFYLPTTVSGILQRYSPHLTPRQNEAANFALIGLIGAAAGCITTPIGGIRTQIHTSPERLTTADAIRKLLNPTPVPKDGALTRAVMRHFHTKMANRARMIERLFAGGASRAGYIGANLCLTRAVYTWLPSYMPAALRRE